MSKSILVTGSRGVIGTQLSKILKGQGHSVIGTRRPNQPISDEPEIVIEPWSRLSLDPHEIDLVVHLAGTYLTKYETAEIKECFDTNVGLASTVANFQKITSTPIIAVGSFFEKAPAISQPWTYYAISKTSSFNLIKEATYLSQSKFVYLYLYDTYGSDKSRGKFVDLVIDAMEQNSILDASNGKQIQDLTHIDDVSNAIAQAIMDIDLLENGAHEFQVRSKEVVTLRELVNLANLKSTKPLIVNWGSYPYRAREVFELWDSAVDLPNWRPEQNLNDYFSQFFSKPYKKGEF